MPARCNELKEAKEIVTCNYHSFLRSKQYDSMIFSIRHTAGIFTIDDNFFKEAGITIEVLLMKFIGLLDLRPSVPRGLFISRTYYTAFPASSCIHPHYFEAI